jgi:hypothetical protein
MAQNITLLGASYSNVPAVQLPKTGGGTASFTDVTSTTAAAEDVASGKYFFTAQGVLTVGTASGGGSGTVVVEDTTDSHGGTIRTITAVDISDTTAVAADVASGKYFYTANGTKTAGTATIGGGNIFLVTVSYNSITEMWEPNCTYAELLTEVQGGKTITVDADVTSEDATADGEWDGDGSGLVYFVHEYNDNSIIETVYFFDSTGLTETGSEEYILPIFDSPSVSYTPSSSAQYDSITYGADYNGIDHVSVTVNAIDPSYIGSGVTRRTSTDLSASGATVTAPSGYYENSATKTVASGTVTAPASIAGTSATVSTGTNTLTLSKTVSVTPSVTTAGYVSSGTAGNSSVSLTASVTTKGATTYNTSSSDQTIASGTYLTGTQTIRGVTTSNLTADNIKQGVTVTVGDSADADRVLSVTGTYSGGGSSKAIYMYKGLASRTANSYGSTNATVTVTKAGTYTISYVAIRGSSSGTMGTNLHIGATTGTNQQTWNNGTYGQYITLTNQTISANTAVTIYATSGSNSRTIYVGQLIVEEE